MLRMAAALAMLAACAPMSGQTRAAGVAACSPCHAEIARTYADTGMGKSFYRASPGAMPEDFSRNNQFHHATSERYYTMAERKGRYFQRRHQMDPNGAEVNIVEKEIHYVLGSGNHSRAYLHLTPAGRLIQLPVGWYAETGTWAMSPGYDRPDHLDFRRKVDKECFFCHNAYPAPETTAASGSRELIFKATPPEGIDCQRCHGTGAEHIRAAQGGRPHQAIRAAIVNPVRLSKDRQREVCFQCHLESTSHPLPYAIRRYGREFFSYNPGDPLAAYMLHFDHAPGTGQDDKFEISHSAYRLLQSACFRKSAGQLTCTTCHNPHEPSGTPAARERYTNACVSCHGTVVTAVSPRPEHRNAANCAACHMPKRRTQDAVRVVMTDHRIVRRSPPGDSLAPLAEIHDSEGSAYRGKVVPLYPAQIAPGDDLYLAVAQVAEGANLQTGLRELEQLLKDRRPAEGEFYLELARALQKAGDHNAALRWFAEALRLNPQLNEARVHQAFSLLQVGKPREAITGLAPTLKAAIADPAALNAAGVSHTQAGQFSEAIQILQKAASLDPDLPETFLNLGSAYFQTKQNGAAVEAMRNAIRLAPDLAPAHANLGSILSLQGNLTAAEFHFAQAVKFQPTNAEAAVNLGLALYRKGDWSGAERLFRSALKAKPNLPTANFNLGLALMRQSKEADAKQQFESVLRSSPHDYEAHFYLATILSRSGDTARAKAHFENASASPNPQIREAALAALSKLR